MHNELYLPVCFLFFSSPLFQQSRHIFFSLLKQILIMIIYSKVQTCETKVLNTKKKECNLQMTLPIIIKYEQHKLPRQSEHVASTTGEQRNNTVMSYRYTP